MKSKIQVYNFMGHFAEKKNCLFFISDKVFICIKVLFYNLDIFNIYC